MDKIRAIYKELHKKYGPQGWWLLSKGRAKTKHHSGPPASHHDRWEITVGAILTQNTSWKNVEKALHNLAVAAVISAPSVNAASLQKLQRLVRPS